RQAPLSLPIAVTNKVYEHILYDGARHVSMTSRLGVGDDYQFSRRLIELTEAATVPGSSFYSDRTRGSTQVRFCFAKRWETLHAVERALRADSVAVGCRLQPEDPVRPTCGHGSGGYPTVESTELP
ncbi:MAG: hypothetical protein ACYC5J_14600, partial [Chloroflexota bacterium]